MKKIALQNIRFEGMEIAIAVCQSIGILMQPMTRKSIVLLYQMTMVIYYQIQMPIQSPLNTVIICKVSFVPVFFTGGMKTTFLL